MRAFFLQLFCLIAYGLMAQGLPIESIGQFGGSIGLSSSEISPAKKQRPSSEFRINMTDSCLQTVQFNLEILNPNNKSRYSWSHGGNITLNNQPGNIVSGQASDTGSFEIQLEARIGFRKSQFKDSLRVYKNPQIEPNDTIITCLNQPLTIAPSIDDCGNCQYIWSTGDTMPSITYSYTSSSDIWLKVTNSFGCSDSQSIHLKVVQLPSVWTGVDTLEICFGDSVLITAYSNESCNFLWSNSDTNSTVWVAPSVSTAFNVFGTTVNGCISNIASTYIRVFDNPTLQMPNEVWLCPEDTFYLSPQANGYGQLIFSWSSGDTNSTIKLTAGNYLRYLTITDEHGCSVTDSIQVHLNVFEPEVPDYVVLCKDDLVNVQVQNVPSSIEYLAHWVFDHDTIFSTTYLMPNWSFSPMSSDTLYGHFKSDSGCYKLLWLYVEVNPLPVNDFVLLAPTYSTIDTVFFNSNLRSPANTYEYRIDGNLYSSRIDTFWLPFDTGTYAVSLITSDSNGCVHTSERLVQIRTFGDRDIKNLIFPNPTNQYLNVAFDSQAGIEYSIVLFDQVGRVILSTTSIAEAHRKTHKFDLSDIPAGKYFIQVSNEETIVMSESFTKIE